MNQPTPTPRPHYRRENTTLYYGDCAEVLPLLDLKPQLILTSPPYGALRTYAGHTFDFKRVASALAKSLPPGGVLVWIVGDQTVRERGQTGESMRQALHFMALGLRLHDTMVFQKAAGGNPQPTRYTQAWQYMFVLTNGRLAKANLLKDKPNTTAGKTSHRNDMGRKSNGQRPIRTRDARTYTLGPTGYRTNVWTYPTGHHHSAPDFPKAHQHPAIFPLALARDHILTWTDPGDIVLDPMAGSGTTMRAAKDLGRHAVGIEIAEEYLPMITERLGQEVLAQQPEEQP